MILPVFVAKEFPMKKILTVLFVFSILVGMTACSPEESGELSFFDNTESAVSASDPSWIFLQDSVVEYDITASSSFRLSGMEDGASGIRSAYFHLEQPAHYQSGGELFRICMDGPEMNQGNHYGVFSMEEDLLLEYPRSYLITQIDLFGQTYRVEMEYTIVNDQVVPTYIPTDLTSWYLADTSLGGGECLVIFHCVLEGGDALDYPVFLNVETGSFRDVLSAMSLSALPTMNHSDPGNTVTYGISAVQVLRDHRLLVRMNGDAHYFFDTPAQKVYNVQILSGRRPVGCTAAADEIFCWDASGNIWSIHMDTLSVTEHEAGAELIYTSGVDTGSSFAMYQDEERKLWVLDFLTGERFPVDSASDWVLDREQLYPSEDGRKFFTFLPGESNCVQLLIFDCDRKTFIQLNRENPNPVRESLTHWVDKNTLVITTESMQDFYVYDWPCQEETQMQTENAPAPLREDTDFVKIKDHIPDLLVEMKYAAADNFTGQAIYDFEEAYLRYGTVMKLAQVQKELKTLGYGLKLWDGFRPVSAQFKLWEIYPDDTYVANPNIGFSSHSRGNTVDVTLVDENGMEIEMPTGFDDFSAKADRDYSDCDPVAAEHAMLLQTVMEKHGFVGYFGEWWHFADSIRYDVERCFDPSVISRYQADCREYITLREQPDTASEALAYIPTRETFTLLGHDGDFSLVEYRGQRGYVLSAYTKPAE